MKVLVTEMAVESRSESRSFKSKSFHCTRVTERLSAKVEAEERLTAFTCNFILLSPDTGLCWD